MLCGTEGSSMRIERQLLQGIAPYAVLALLNRKEMHGYELIEALAPHKDAVLPDGEGFLYPLLFHLQTKKWITYERRTASEDGPERNYYKLTEEGREALEILRRRWEGMSSVTEDVTGRNTPVNDTEGSM
jgi:PadR family transcriptional regulator PadR